MNTTAVRVIQTRLKELDHYAGAIDGDRGPKTNAAIEAALTAHPNSPIDWQNWSDKRQAVAFLQLMCHDEDIDAGSVDGWWGPQTDFAFDALMEMQETGERPRLWRDFEPPEDNPNGWPRQTQDALEAFYGPHGLPDGRTPPLVRVDCPWTLRLAWDQRRTLTQISIHKECAESLARILDKVHRHYGEREIERLDLNLYGGSYAPRKMRRGSRWSTHSWAIAIDWDPGRNKLDWGRDRASLAGPDYEDWWGFWEAEGWVSLGRARNFDWMHVQAARL